MRGTALLLILGLFVLACSSPATPTPTATLVPTATPTPAPCPPSGRLAKQYEGPPPMVIDAGKTYTATLHTYEGDIVIELLDEEAPLTVNNFVFLAQDGFYDCVRFHRVVKGFMVQSGDPTGTGSGGPGYRFEDETVTRDYVRGTMAMANAGPNTNGSQFFIMHRDSSLPKSYTIFGLVREGMEVVDAIATVPVTANALGEISKPTVPLYVESVEITVESP